MFIIKIIKNILKWIGEHVVIVLSAAAAFFATCITSAFINLNKAKKINSKVAEIQKTALDKHDVEFQMTQGALESLGENKRIAINSFETFADAIEKIQGRPEFNDSFASDVTLTNITLSEIKCISNDFKIMISGAGAAGLGTLAGLAAFGASAIIAAPAMVASGIVICSEARKLKEKAIANEEQANILRRDVNRIIKYYKDVRSAALCLSDSLDLVYGKYTECLCKLNTTLTTTCLWVDFTQDERINTENTVLLAKLLYQICKVNVIQSDKNKETVNWDEVEQLESQSETILQSIA